MFRSFSRLATKASNNATASSAVPDVLAQYSSVNNQMTFVSHPGVMALSRLVEVGNIVRWMPKLTQEKVNDIREFDPELADKAQVALDNNVTTSWVELEFINEPGVLERLKKENKLQAEARKEIMERQAGNYEPVKCVANDSYHVTLPYQPLDKRGDLDEMLEYAKENNFVEYWLQLQRQKQKVDSNKK